MTTPAEAKPVMHFTVRTGEALCHALWPPRRESTTDPARVTCETCLRYMRSEETERERDGLAAIVAKMPKTADGVPVALGMNVYIPANTVAMADGAYGCGFVSMELQDDEAIVGVIRTSGGDEYEDISVDQCYSTAEAALARATPPQPDGTVRT